MTRCVAPSSLEKLSFFLKQGLYEIHLESHVFKVELQ